MRKNIRRGAAFLLCLVMLLTSVNMTAFAGSLSAVSSVSASNCNGGIKIKWKKVKGADGYRVYKKSGKKWKKLADTTALSYKDKKVKNLKSYTYRVKAYKGKKKKFSAASSSVTQKYLKAPTFDFYIESQNLVVCYNDVRGAKYYYVYRSTKKNGPYKLVSDRDDEVYYEDSGTITGKCYYYKFRCSDGKVKSGYSKPYKIQTTYQSGDCAIADHKVKLIKTVKPTALTPGYKVYSCKCGREYYAKALKEPKGVTMPSGNDYAYAEAVKRNQKSVEYLEMIRKRDKTDLLQVRTGTEEEIRFLKKQSDEIVKGCKTDAEKIRRVYDWVTQNISDDSQCSSFPTDVIRDKCGDCQGQSNLAVDLLRLQNIPSASIIGYRGDTKHTCTENNIDKLNGHVKHQWVRAYDGSRWVFFDCIWDTFDPDPNTFDIPEWYYTQFTDYAGVYYKGINLRNQLGFPFYVNGHYYGFNEKGTINHYSSGCFLDDQNIYYEINDFSIAENGGRSNYFNADNVGLFEVFTDRAIYEKENPGTNYKKDVKPWQIAYYNGICVTDTSFTLNGMHFVNSLCITYSDYSGKYLTSYEGDLVLYPGDTIKLKDSWTVFNKTSMIVTCEDPKILKVDNKGNVKALKEGGTYVNFRDKNHHHDYGLYIYVKDPSYKLKASDLAPKSSIKVQRSKIRIKY